MRDVAADVSLNLAHKQHLRGCSVLCCLLCWENAAWGGHRAGDSGGFGCGDFGCCAVSATAFPFLAAVGACGAGDGGSTYGSAGELLGLRPALAGLPAERAPSDVRARAARPAEPVLSDCARAGGAGATRPSDMGRARG